MTDLPQHHIQRIDARIDAAEQRLSTLETGAAVADERLRQIQKSLDGIHAGIGRIVWLVVTGLAGGLVTFILDGGLGGL
jgi:hypothetical protein